MAVIKGTAHCPNWGRTEAFNHIYGDFLDRLDRCS